MSTLNRTIKSILLATTLCAGTALSAETYGPFPVTLQGYEGEKTNTVSYGGQIARHVLENSLKKLAGTGNGAANAAELEAQMLSYFDGSDADLPIIAPVSKDGFAIKQTTIDEISSGKNISGKFYEGAMPAWPGNMTGKQVAYHMIKRAALANKGFDPETGYDFAQLISKFTMGAMAYNQAVDNYLDEKLEADTKPNNAAYGEGKQYTGKEHSWDEGFGYWGAPAHALELSANDIYNISKLKSGDVADANGDGVIDLKSEMVFGPAYYAASFDRSGDATSYARNIMSAYFEGRKVIVAAGGETLSDTQRASLKRYAAEIESNWEMVLAEATFKYAGSVYGDIAKLQAAEGDDAKAEAFRTYGKHWSEMKGFAMALQTGKNNLGATAVELNNLIGFGPVTMNNSYVTGVDAEGNFVKDKRMTWNDYQLNMLKVQKLLSESFGIKALNNNQLADLEGLAEKLGAASNAETD